MKNIKKAHPRHPGFLQKQRGKIFNFLLHFMKKSGIILRRGFAPATFKTTHPGIAFPSALLSGQRGMIGVEEKQKEK
ncbi:MAG: hypothetical protein SO355_02030 [Candidatus Faecousia sp.]|nr:hypothetical protein [Bacillota bacterium]MDY4754110.1 hypothetical protein [Candidatus Faecousia sp.]MDY6161532.1 hypothetical protein [Candidatus Faecousia sp.]